MEPENEEVSPRYILKYSARGGSNMFQLFDTAEKNDHFVASGKRWLESQGKKATKQECWQNEWHDIKYHVVMAKAPPCPERTLENATAAAKLAFIQGRRKPVGRCGRQ